MKCILIFLLFPLLVFGQTIHTEDDEICYKGNVALSGMKTSNMLTQLQEAVQKAAAESKGAVEFHYADTSLRGQGTLQLNTPFDVVRMLRFSMQLKPTDNGYHYRIDSVAVVEKHRGGTAKEKKSKALLEGVEETGTVAIETEKLLNEIDLRLQKFLTLMETAAQKPDSR